VSAASFVRVASLGELPSGGLLAVDVAGEEILLARLADRVYAIGNVCTHDQVWLDDGTLHEGSCEIECPMHDGRFDLQTGAATREPCVEPVPSYPVRVDGDDVLIDVQTVTRR
jgi:nitrite reductase/ring-hydroxylating ferredoxin subunit